MLKNRSNKIHQLFLLLSILLACFPLLTFGMRSVLTIVWILVGITLYITKRKQLIDKREILIFIGPFLLISFSLLYSTNLEYGFALLVKMLSFVAFPIVFFLNRDFFIKKNIHQICNVFSISVLILVLFQLFKVVYDYNFISATLSLQEIKANGFSSMNEISLEKIQQIKLRRFRNYIIAISNTHSTYQGLWLCFGIFFIVLKIREATKNIERIIYVFITLIFIFWMYLISARMPLIALVISSIITFFVFSKYSLKKKLFIGLIPFLALTMLLVFKNPFSTRVKEYYQTGFSVLEKTSSANQFNSSNVRNGIYYCDIKLMQKSILIGVGLGDVQDELNVCYRDNMNAKIYQWHDFNSHNQYAFFWIASGFLGFLSFLILIASNFLRSISKRNKTLFYITCLTTIVFLSENILERSDGVLFYSFFTALFYFNKVKK